MQERLREPKDYDIFFGLMDTLLLFHLLILLAQLISRFVVNREPYFKEFLYFLLN